MLKLQHINKTDFPRIYKDMLLQFPKEELKSFETFNRLINDENYIICDICNEENIVGYTAILNIPKYNVLWLDYIAIFKEYQSSGYGSKILNTIKKTFDYMDGIFLEVEKPNPNEINTLRRINFYKKAGAYKVDINYIYPNNSNGLPMDLYFIDFKGKNTEKTNKFCKKVITNAFEKIHFDIENISEILNNIC